MAKVRDAAPSKPRRMRPALDPEAREAQMINLAIDLAEKQLREGTASSQVLTHYLKLGTTKYELEKEKIKHENKKMEAQTKSLESGEEMKILYDKAIKAMRNYSGYGDPEEYEQEW